MIPIIVLTVILTIFFFIFDKQKTLKGIKKGSIMFIKILPTILSVIILVSIVLYFVNDEFLTRYLGKNAGVLAYAFAAIIGTISIIPGLYFVSVGRNFSKNRGKLCGNIGFYHDTKNGWYINYSA